MIRKSIPLPQLGIRTPSQHLATLNYAIQQAQGQTADAFNGLGITQVQYGTLTFSGGGLSTTVTFNTPFPDAGYVVLTSFPMPVVKTPQGFTVTIDTDAPGYPVDWIAVR